MTTTESVIVALFCAGFSAVALAKLVLLDRFAHRVEQGQVLVVSTLHGMRVSFSGAVVLPILHRAEVMDIRVTQLVLERTLECKDGIQVDVRAVFYIRVNPIRENILEVADTIGCERASRPATLHSLFEARLSEAMKEAFLITTARKAPRRTGDLSDEILSHLGRDLHGFIVDNVAIDHIGQPH